MIGIRKRKLKLKELEKRLLFDASLGALATTTVFAENTVNSGAQILDSDVSVTGTTTNFDGETLSISTSGGASDQLSINNEGSGAGQIGFDGTNITYGGTQIGTITSDGTNGSTLSILLDANSTKAGVERLIENITYQNGSDNPATNRTLTFALGAFFSEDMTVTVVGQNEGPSIDTNTGLAINEGDTTTITSAHLGISDPDDLDTDVTFTITSAVTHGRVELSTNAGVSISSFTLNDLNSGKVRYVHDGLENTSDSFDFSVADGGEDGATAATDTFSITITPVNDAPVLTTNAGSDVFQGFSTTIGAEEVPALFGTEVLRQSTTGQFSNFQSIVDNNDSQLRIIITTGASDPTASPGEVIFESGGSGKGIGLYLNNANQLTFYAGTSGTTPYLTSATLAHSTQYAIVIEIDQTNNELRLNYAQAGDFNWYQYGRTPEDNSTGFTQTDMDGGNGAGLGVVGSGSYGGWNGSISGTTTFQGTIDSDFVITRPPSGGTTYINTKLIADDVDSPNSSLIYTITTNVSDGTLYKNGVAIGLNDTFTQADLDSGIITYTHGGAANPTDSFIFSLTDGTTTTTGQTYTIRVSTSNTTPDLPDQTLQVAENAANGTSAGVLQATDPDVGQSLTYSITGGTGAGIFTIDAATGDITVLDNSTLDYETTTSYTLSVRVTDDGPGNLFADRTFTINILDVSENTAPTFPAQGPFSIGEDAAVNDAVGTVTATDPEGQTISYSIVGGNTGSVFKINSSTGVISINSTANLDYETLSTYTLTIRATDNDAVPLFTNRNVTINITDVNEAPSFAAQDVIYYLDPSVSYSSATGNFYKYINSNVNYATALAAADDVALNGVYGHMVTITSNAERTFVLSVMSSHIWLAASDADTEGKWVWTAGPETGQQFSQGGTAVNGLYENWSGSEPNTASYDYAYMNTNGTWYDQAGTEGRRYVIEWEGSEVINNDTYVINHANADASDITNGTSVGYVQAGDADGDAITYAITGGNADGIFEVDAITGEVRIADNTNLDATVQDTYVLTMRATDANGLYTEINITVNFDNTFSLTTNAPLTVNESATAVITTTNLDVTDADTAATDITFTVTSQPPNGRIAFASAPGVQINSFTLDDLQNNRVVYVHGGSETLSDSFEFSITDGATTSAGNTFSITVNPQNDAPSISTNTGTTVLEGGSKIITSAMLNSVDADDTAAGRTYTATTLNYGTIEVNGVTQNTFTQADINANLVRFIHDGSENNGSFAFSLADGGEDGAGAATGTFTLTRTPVNDSPTVSVNAGATVVEGSTVAINNTNLAATDVDDSDPTLIYTLSATQNGQVELSTNPGVPIISFTQANLNAGQVVFRHDGSENQGRFNFSVADGGEDGATPATGTFTFAVSPVNDSPVITTQASTTVDTGNFVLIKKSVLNTTDPDDSGTGLTYTVNSSTNGQLELLSNPGVAITTFTQDDINNSRVVFRHDGTATLTAQFQVTVADGGEDGAITDSATINLTVNNTNDSPTITLNTGATMNEGGALAITTAMLDSFDPDDSGTGLTWTISNVSANGQLELTTNPGVAITSFTQADLDNGTVVFIHDGGETTSASFDVTLADGGENGATTDSATFSITVTPVNEGPTLVLNDGDPNILNLNDYTFNSYSASPGQDINGTVTVSADGSTVTFTNANAWKQINTPYTVTANTVLSFEFFADTELEIQGIGFENDGGFGFNGYQIAGSQSWLLNTGFKTYKAGDGWVRFDIPIGNDYTGVMNTMIFTVDNDVNAAGVTAFRNIGFYEANQVVAMNEGGNLTLTNAMFNSVDPDDAAADLTFTASNIENGHIEVNGVAQNTFTQDDINNSRVVFVHDGSEGSYAGFDVSLADGGEDGASADTGHFDIIVNRINDAPTIATNTGATMNEGASLTITTAMLNEGDVDDNGSELTYTVSNLSNGIIQVNGITKNTFTQTEIDQGKVRFIHNGSETITAGFDISLADGGENGAAPATGSFAITVTPVNDAVVLATNTGTNITESGTVTVTSAMLSATDADDTASGITYSVTSTQNGWVELTTKTGFPVTSFTQDDINNNRVVFRHDGSGAANANFAFSVVDGGENGAAASTGTFAVNVNAAVNEGPTVAVTDGAPTTIDFSTSTITAYDPSGAGDGQGSTFTDYKVSSDGTVLSVYGNSWKKIALPTTITADTVITFDFRSTKEGEIHVIGFDNDNAISNGSFAYELFGADANALFKQGFNTYNLGDGWVRYEIPIGADFTGAVTHMYFAADDDGSSDAISQFRNVSIYEKNPAVTVAEGGSVTITNANLNAFDTDDAPAGLTYTVSNLSNGVIKVSGVTQNTFTQDDINNNRVTFVHDDSETLTAGFDLSLADGGENGAGADTASFAITVTPVNEGPSISTNTGATMNEGANLTITTAMLNAADVDDAATGLTYTVSNLSNGIIKVSGVTQNTFTQDDINNNRVVFIHDGGETTSAGFDLSLADGGENGTSAVTGAFAITVSPINDAPTIATNTGATINEGASLTITTAMLNEGDPDDAGTGLTYTASNLSNGIIQVSGVVQNTFTQDDINNNRVVFIHDGSETIAAGFDLSLADGGENAVAAATGTFNITVTPVNDTPYIVNNTGATVLEGGTTVLSNAMLSANDADNAAAGLTYTLSAVGNGTLENTNTSTILGIGATFTQSDIDNGYIRYIHDGGETTSANIGFVIGDGSASSGGQTFTLSVTPVNDAPTDIILSASEVEENLDAGTVVGNLTTDDADLPGDAFTYTLLDDAGGLFEIVGNELRITGPLDYEAGVSYDIRVQTDDGNGGVFDRIFTIDVMDIAERTGDGHIEPEHYSSEISDPQRFDGPAARIEEEFYGLSKLLGQRDRAERSGFIEAALAGEGNFRDTFYGDALRHLSRNQGFSVIAAQISSGSFTVDQTNRTGQAETPEQGQAPDQAGQYTNLREVMAYLQSLGEGQSDNPADHTTDELSALHQQFEDVLTYQQAKQARLREALSDQG